ncbi:MAG: TusE/DsrC/DsvC family sulfur relay protein [Candidatus Sedimenticola sp. (ex Thyasira tokunagai)]
MQALEVNGITIPLNSEGYLESFSDWSEDVAQVMADIDELKLIDCHWVAINYLREFYHEYEVPPSDRLMIKSVGKKISEYGCTKKKLNEIFPKGGCKHACRLAGLPASYCHSC